MPKIHAANAQSIIADLARPPRLSNLHPIAARFVYSLRLIAVHEHARRDPVAELAVRLGSMDVAAKSLSMAKVIARVWPENIQVSRFCCGLMSHDEATIGYMIEATAHRDRAAFDRVLEGLIRPGRAQALWDASIDLVAAEFRGA
ncbi:DNA-directed RNA polymerase subunit beta' [Erythrobacter sp. YT30]|uniref:DNA-directed RNA polymerase subunit beta' n=1 Tax=Erythrobacter sp. YT30 TaxID=1735012 RepID=UPI00076BC9FD|nr:DNA-directed RNA polymerase subunit beta' [Erythrobacter sp. YT30]KWV91183.1 DNA-directed RNA polymerase subunit beta' [Erythrobacter sp. YT30]